MIPAWKTITGGAIEMDDTTDFFQKLLEIAKEHHCLSLQSYSQKLLESIENFDIELIEGLLKAFPVHIEKEAFFEKRAER